MFQNGNEPEIKLEKEGRSRLEKVANKVEGHFLITAATVSFIVFLSFIVVVITLSVLGLMPGYDRSLGDQVYSQIADSLSLIFGTSVAFAGSLVAIKLAQSALNVSNSQEKLAQDQLRLAQAQHDFEATARLDTKVAKSVELFSKYAHVFNSIHGAGVNLYNEIKNDYLTNEKKIILLSLRDESGFKREADYLKHAINNNSRKGRIDQIHSSLNTRMREMSEVLLNIMRDPFSHACLMRSIDSYSTAMCNWYPVAKNSAGSSNATSYYSSRFRKPFNSEDIGYLASRMSDRAERGYTEDSFAEIALASMRAEAVYEMSLTFVHKQAGMSDEELRQFLTQNMENISGNGTAVAGAIFFGALLQSYPLGFAVGVAFLIDMYNFLPTKEDILRTAESQVGVTDDRLLQKYMDSVIFDEGQGRSIRQSTGENSQHTYGFFSTPVSDTMEMLMKLMKDDREFIVNLWPWKHTNLDSSQDVHGIQDEALPPLDRVDALISKADKCSDNNDLKCAAFYYNEAYMVACDAFDISDETTRIPSLQRQNYALVMSGQVQIDLEDWKEAKASYVSMQDLARRYSEVGQSFDSMLLLMQSFGHLRYIWCKTGDVESAKFHNEKLMEVVEAIGPHINSVEVTDSERDVYSQYRDSGLGFEAHQCGM